MKLSVVIPAYNEEQNLPTLHARLTAVLTACAEDHELIFVNDHSRDRTLEVLRRLAETDPRVRYRSFSRNFGHEMAVAAGMEAATGDAVVVMDADLQDPPELIAKLVERWKDGVHVAYAQRRSRQGDPLLKRAAIYVFYRLLGRISEIDIPLDTGNYRLMDRRVVDIVMSCPENPRFMRGLVPWAGFRQEPVLFDRDARLAGKTNYSVTRLFRLAYDGICSFSLVPLRLSTWLGSAAIGLAVVLTLVVVLDWIFRDSQTVPRGFAFLACVVLFTGGVQLFMLGMLSTYVGYIFKNVQRRPMYIVAEESRPAAVSADGGSLDAGSRPEVIVRPRAVAAAAGSNGDAARG